MLTHNGTSLNMSADGPFTFTNKLPNGATYTVTTTQPTGQTCTVASGGGTISAANVTNVAISCVVNSAGPVYYVAPTGDDSRSPTQARNASTPWRTITKAANTLVAGDTVQVRAGTYAEKVAPAHSGSATAGHITFMAYPGETVVMDATGIFSSAVPAWDGAFNISDKSYIKIIGFQIPVSDGFGVFIQNSNHIEVRKNIISHTQFSGVFAKESSYITVDGNDIGFANISMNQESISMVSVTQFSIGNNIVHDGHKEGIDAKNASAYGKIFNNEVYGIARIGIYIEGFGSDQTDIDVYGNIVRDGNPAASGAGEDGIRVGNEYGARESNIRIFNNIVYNARKNGISIDGWTHDGSGAVFTNISIYNNTSYGNGFSGNGGSGIRIDAANNVTGLVVRNNIAVGNKSDGITGIPSGQTQSNNFVSGDPKFVDVANHTFHLKAGSPVIDTGFTILGLTTDFSGAARPHGAGFDIGALEYRGDL